MRESSGTSTAPLSAGRSPPIRRYFATNGPVVTSDHFTVPEYWKTVDRSISDSLLLSYCPLISNI